MALSINPLTYVIFVPQSFLTFAGGVSYQLNTNVFRLALRDWEDSEEGIYEPITHNHNTTVLLGGIQYARVLEILSPYTITFEETGTPYSVTLTGSNNNILDKTNLGTVQILSNNSAGLIQTTIWDEPIANHLLVGTTGKALSDAGSAGNPWGSPVEGNTAAGTFGELVGKKLLTVAKFLGLK